MVVRYEKAEEAMRVLREVFGFGELRPGQESVVRAVMSGRDTLAIMPTGGGKSLCYQLPALCRPGLTVVVSPLIALMKDQVDALQARGVAAAAVNSSLSAEEYRRTMNELERGELRILYVAPERFAQEGFMRRLRETGVALLAVDEAHCLSQWGHDFRPDYLRLGRVRETLGMPPIVALTATATEHVRGDIISSLRLHEPEVIISGFARSNLSFAITRCDSRNEKFARIRELISTWRTGIIYCSTRKNVTAVYKEIAPFCNAVAYHAGMTDEERAFSQEAFVSGRADVVVATNAFGMGIDRADVRFVIHFEIPGSVEAYYQEAGRAGRDGQAACCELLFNHADLKTQEFFFEGSNPPLALIRSLYEMLRCVADAETHELALTVDAMTERLGRDVNPMAVSTALSALVHAGAIARTDSAGGAKITRLLRPQDPFTALPIHADELEEKARRDHLKIEAITRYAYSSGCRQMWVLEYFGELGSAPCGRCDACCARPAADATELTGEPAELVRKALSGVARASRRLPTGEWRGIYGRGRIMDMLRGSRKATVNAHLRSLSTFGILERMTSPRLRALFRAMEEAGLVQLIESDSRLPLLTLTRRGEQVMKAQEPPVLSTRDWAATPPPAAKRRTPPPAAPDAYADSELYEKLAELRRDLAREYHIPAYRILSNAALQALATLQPTTPHDAARIKGIGAWTISHTLRYFLALIRSEKEEL